jgi:hypothetical protein
VRGLTALFALLLTFQSLAVEEPFVLQAGVTNILSLPEKSECVWFGFERDLTVDASLSMSSNSLANQYSVNLAPSADGTFALPLPEANCEFIAACRLKVNGRWRSIHPVLIDRCPISTNAELKLGETYKGVLKESPARLVIHFKHSNLPRNSEISENLEIVANRIGSSLDSVVRFSNQRQHEQINDDGENSGRDSVLDAQFGERIDGVLEIADVANASGGEYFYCLRTKYPPLINLGPPCGLAIHDPLRPFFVPLSRRATKREAEPNDRPASAVDTFLNERIVGSFGKPRDVDWYRFTVTAGEKIVVSAATRQFGENCDAGLALYDEAGKLLADSVGAGTEGPSITNKIASDGTLRLEVREISRKSGNYWLTIEKAEQGVALTTEVERVDFSKGGEAKIKIACKRYDYDGPVKLEVSGLPDGVSLTDSVIEKGKNEGELKFKREKEGDGFQVRITGVIESKEGFPVSTMPALRKLYPLQMFPCAAMDGWIAVNPAP